MVDRVDGERKLQNEILHPAVSPLQENISCPPHNFGIHGTIRVGWIHVAL